MAAPMSGVDSEHKRQQLASGGLDSTEFGSTTVLPSVNPNATSNSQQFPTNYHTEQTDIRQDQIAAPRFGGPINSKRLATGGNASRMRMNQL